jgi:hypothetical protein
MEDNADASPASERASDKPTQNIKEAAARERKALSTEDDAASEAVSEEEDFSEADYRPNPEDDAKTRAELEAERLQEQVFDLQSDRAFREKYAPKILRLIQVWLSVVVAILLLDGVGIPSERWRVTFDLSDQVLLALIGGTTASVIGLLVIVITYIFPRRNKGPK